MAELKYPPNEYIDHGARSTAVVELKKAFPDLKASEPDVRVELTIGELKIILEGATKAGYQNAWADAVSQMEDR